MQSSFTRPNRIYFQLLAAPPRKKTYGIRVLLYSILSGKSRHFSLRRHHWFPREMTSLEASEETDSILMTRHHTDLGSVSGCLAENLIHPIRSATHILVVTRHQYGICALDCFLRLHSPSNPARLTQAHNVS